MSVVYCMSQFLWKTCILYYCEVGQVSICSLVPEKGAVPCSEEVSLSGLWLSDLWAAPPLCCHREALCLLHLCYLQLSSGKGRAAPTFLLPGLGKQFWLWSRLQVLLGRWRRAELEGCPLPNLPCPWRGFVKPRQGQHAREREEVFLPHPLRFDQSLLERFRCLCTGKQPWHLALC